MDKLTKKYRIVWNEKTGGIISAGEFNPESITIYNSDRYKAKDYEDEGWYKNKLDELKSNKGDK